MIILQWKYKKNSPNFKAELWILYKFVYLLNLFEEKKKTNPKHKKLEDKLLNSIN